MAITRLNSLAIPAGTVEPADISYPLTNFSSTGIDDNATSTAITIDSSQKATFSNSIEATVAYRAYDAVAAAYRNILRYDSGNVRLETGSSGSQAITAFTGGAERMRIDSSGNVLVGATTYDATNEGIFLGAGGILYSTNTSGFAASLNRKTTDGDILRFQKDSSTVGSIFSYNGFLGIGSTSGNDAYVLMGSDFVAPATSTGAARDAAIDLGTSTRRFKDLYLRGKLTNNGTGGINIDTSGNVGIGTDVPDGKLNVFSASAGSVNADADADELVLENSGNVGLSLLTASTGESGIYFGNPGTNGQKDFYLKFYHESHATTANRRAFTFNTGSAERMRIAAGGNVGIGTTSPSTKLHLGGTAPLDSIIRQDSTVSGTNWEIGERAAGKWQIWEDDSDSVVATFTSSGLVGIGTTSPVGPLSVVAASGGGAIDVFGRSADGLGWLSFKTNNGSSSHSLIGTPIADTLAFYTNGFNERMRIDSSGKVGIGTSSPNAPLTIAAAASNAGDAALSIYRLGNGYGNIRSSSNYGVSLQLAGASDNADEVRLTQDNTKIGYLYNEASAALLFGTNNTERMRIDSTGNVMVNVASPSGGNGGTGAFHVRQDNTSSTTAPIYATNELGSGTLILFSGNGGAVSTANRIYHGGAGVVYGSSSDERLKKNITSAPSALAVLESVDAVSFDWKATVSTLNMALSLNNLLMLFQTQ